MSVKSVTVTLCLVVRDYEIFIYLLLQIIPSIGSFELATIKQNIIGCMFTDIYRRFVTKM